MSTDLAAQVASVAERLLARGERLAVAESCTGGLLAMLCTDLAGSSAWFERGLVTYSNEAKHELLGVPQSIFREHGAVSEACVRAMVSGLMQRSPADWTLAVTGIAGPGGGSPGRPVGTVWMGWMHRGEPEQVQCVVFPGNRTAVREQTAAAVLGGLLNRLRHAG